MLGQEAQDASAALYAALAAIIVAAITVVGNLLSNRRTRKDTKHIAQQVGVVNGGNGRESLFDLVREMFRSLVHLEYDSEEQKNQTIAINRKLDQFGVSLNKYGRKLDRHITESEPIHEWVKEQMIREAKGER